MPRMPCRVFASSSGSAYESRMTSSRRRPAGRGPRPLLASATSFLVASSVSFNWASASAVRVSISALRLAPSTRACASFSFVSRVEGDDTDPAPSLSTLATPQDLQNGVERLLPGHVPERDGHSTLHVIAHHDVPAALGRQDAAAELTTSASLKSSEISLSPDEGAGAEEAAGARVVAGLSHHLAHGCRRDRSGRDRRHCGSHGDFAW